MVFAQFANEGKTEQDISHISSYHCYAKDCPNQVNYVHTTMADGENGDIDNEEEIHIFYQIGNKMQSKD